jgi:hypothetical protein
MESSKPHWRIWVGKILAFSISSNAYSMVWYGLAYSTQYSSLGKENNLEIPVSRESIHNHTPPFLQSPDADLQPQFDISL